jgi:hypothetical protein
MPQIIRELFEKPIERHIEGVVKADDESDLETEVMEYVVTKEVSKRLDDLLEAYLQGGSANGVWIAGFFGSGKSHLLKILSLLLENRFIGTTSVAELFLPKVINDPLLKADLEKAIKIPSRSVRFNIDQKADLIAKDQMDALLAVFVKVFNELRGYYPKQGYIAELEADLDARGQFGPFKEAYRAESGRSWEQDRDVVHTLENETFARAYAKVSGTAYDEALQILDRKQASYKVSIESFAASVNCWLALQSKGFRLNFFVDEVGQFIGTNSKLMLNLQTLAETLATKCQGNAWLFVTSQGDLATVLGEMTASQGNDFTKIQGRFKTLLNLTSQDVAEVICRRLLAKNPPKPVELISLYTAEKDNLKTLFQFDGESRRYLGYKDEEDFCNFYPFHPCHFELLQESLIALSKHNFFTGRQRSIGERSMLGILQDVVKSVAGEPIGSLATFDRMFEGVRSALRGDLQASVLTAERQLGGTNQLAVRLLKVLFLLKFIVPFKSTPRNLAILLIDRLDIDIAGHEKAVKQALNRLESDTYIQRNGDTYEFLTDDEKDVETEIKNTEVDEEDISDLLGRIIFDNIIKESKLRYEDNKQDYSFTRRLDGKVFARREYDICLHLASPFHESYGEQAALVAQSMGKAEVLAILPDNPRLMADLKLYCQTDKYVRQNPSASLSEARRRILEDKGHQNSERLKSLNEMLKDSLCRARLILNGSELVVTSTDPATRIAKAFQELVRYAFPSLKMLKKNFTEQDLRETLTTPADDFFKNDDGTMGEAEKEITINLTRQRSLGQRVAVSDLLTAFEKKPYGWPQVSIQCLIARLFMRGKVELRNGGNVLSADEALGALTSNRAFANTIVTLQEQFDSTDISKLKTFHRDFFDEANSGSEAKEVARKFQDKLRDEAAELEKLASHEASYPFLAKLKPIASDLKALADREWSHCLKNLPDFRDNFLDAKESTIDPLKQFYSGPKRGIFDQIRTFLRDEQPNFADVSDDGANELRTIVDSDVPYKDNTLQEAKVKLETLRNKVEAVVASARGTATAKITQALNSVEALPDFGKMAGDEKAEVRAPFENALKQVQSERLAPVVRQISERTARETLPQQMQRVHAILAKQRQAQSGGAAAATPAEYVSADTITVAFDKAVIETDADLEAYLAALKTVYSDELKKNRRITL